MTLWSVRVAWMQEDVEAASLNHVLERLRGDPVSLAVDEQSGDLAMAVALYLQADTDTVALRQAHYLVSEATHFKASDIELQICRALPRQLKPNVMPG